MKLILNLLWIIFLVPFSIKSQSIIEYQVGTILEVTGAADICADSVIIKGTYLGNGTKCNAPLPAELTSFSATTITNKIELHWRTASEKNNYGFDIERKQEAEENRQSKWEKIGFINGGGTSTSPKQYKFVDAKLPAGKYSYRLKQKDYDGSFTYSGIVEAEVSLPNEFTLFQNYPNPFNPTTTIKWQLPAEGHVSLKVFEILGKKVMTLVNENREAGYYEINFDGSSAAGGLASGMYIYRLNVTGGAGNYISTKKMLLLR